MNMYRIFKVLIFSSVFLLTFSCTNSKSENDKENQSEKVEKTTKLKKKKPLKFLKKEAEKLPIELVDKVMESYLKLKDNLVENNTKSARANAKKIVTILAQYQDMEVSYPLTAVQETAYEISQIKNIAIQREYFRPLSKNLYKIVLKNTPTKPLYLLHCPMAFNEQGADWLSLTSKIENPYYGKNSKMFTCGTSKAAIARM